jgi:predicted kinase
MVGLPAAGKTTRARGLAAADRALRLTPDHWMVRLFGDSMADGKRWVLEGRLISVALQALRLGTSVVLDFGLWGRDPRPASRLAGLGGVGSRPLAFVHRQLMRRDGAGPLCVADPDRGRCRRSV